MDETGEEEEIPLNAYTADHVVPLTDVQRLIQWTCPGSVDTFPSRSVLFSQSNLLELSRA
jgi:hypothetical protein